MPRYYISAGQVNPVSRILAGIFAVLAIVGAVVFGVIVLAVVLGLGILFWVSLSIRGWWQRRKSGAIPPDSGNANPDVIEAEYTVISRRREKRSERH